MELVHWLIIYASLLMVTIILVVTKRTHWFSIIGVAVLPIYFLFVIFDATKSPGTSQ